MSAAPTSVDEHNVHLGFWINWSYGRISGATLTLSQENGGLLIAFLAIFVALVSKSYWRIVCFCLHSMLSSKSPQDALYHQRQAILRNSTTAEIGIASFIRMFWSWRGKRVQAIKRLLPLLLLAGLSSAAFAVAGIFSSNIARSWDNEVLIQSNSCGMVRSRKNITAEQALSILVPHWAERASKASNYALQCYSNSSTSTNCNTYVKDQLHFTAETNASCPFYEGICLSRDRNIKVDTGYINTVTDLGLNLPPEYQLQFRFLYHCAPLTTEGYSEIRNETNSTEATIRLNYGKPFDRANITQTYQYYATTRKNVWTTAGGGQDYTTGYDKPSSHLTFPIPRYEWLTNVYFQAHQINRRRQLLRRAQRLPAHPRTAALRCRRIPPLPLCQWRPFQPQVQRPLVRRAHSRRLHLRTRLLHTSRQPYESRQPR